MQGLRRPLTVVFLFPDGGEIRALDALPRHGQRVRSSKTRQTWLVTDVVQSGANTYTATCVGARDFIDQGRRRRPRDLATDLLSMVRATIRSDRSSSHARSEELRDNWIEKYLALSTRGRPAAEVPPRTHRSETASDWFERYLERGLAASTGVTVESRSSGRRARRRPWWR